MDELFTSLFNAVSSKGDIGLLISVSFNMFLIYLLMKERAYSQAVTEKLLDDNKAHATRIEAMAVSDAIASKQLAEALSDVASAISPSESRRKR